MTLKRANYLNNEYYFVVLGDRFNSSEERSFIGFMVDDYFGRPFDKFADPSTLCVGTMDFSLATSLLEGNPTNGAFVRVIVLLRKLHDFFRCHVFYNGDRDKVIESLKEHWGFMSLEKRLPEITDKLQKFIQTFLVTQEEFDTFYAVLRKAVLTTYWEYYQDYNDYSSAEIRRQYGDLLDYRFGDYIDMMQYKLIDYKSYKNEDGTDKILDEMTGKYLDPRDYKAPARRPNAVYVKDNKLCW